MTELAERYAVSNVVVPASAPGYQAPPGRI
jgi:hypothetical protein